MRIVSREWDSTFFGYPVAAAELDHSPASVAEVAAALGIRTFRLTGGEPLLRGDIVEVVRRIARIEGEDGLDAVILAHAGLERLGLLACQLIDAPDLPHAITLLPALQASAHSGLTQLHAALQAETAQQRPSTRQEGTT